MTKQFKNILLCAGNFNTLLCISFLEYNIFIFFLPDIDECVTGLHDCLDTVFYCVNTLGSYKCLCSLGFTGDGLKCMGMCELPNTCNVTL